MVWQDVTAAPPPAPEWALIDTRVPEPPAGSPWWEAPWIAPDLKAALFAPGGDVFWIADPTVYASVTDGGLIESARSGVRPLVPDRLPEIEDAAPRLVGPLDRENPDGVTRNAFGVCMHQRVGIFVSTAARAKALADHLTSFVSVHAAGHEKPLLLRFWDPSVVLTYANANATRPERLARFLMPRDGSRLRVFAAAAPGTAALLSPPDGVSPASGRPDLDATELAAFARVEQQRFVRSSVSWLIARFGGDSELRSQMEYVAAAQLAPLKDLGVTTEYAVNFALAGLYLLRTDVAGLGGEGRAILTKEDTPQDVRAETFLNWAEQNGGGPRQLPDRENHDG